MGIYRIHRWIAYRETARKLMPVTMFYSLDPHPLRKPPWGLKLIFYHKLDSYIFQDYADELSLHKTKIPIKGKNPNEVPILEEDIRQFIYTQIEKIHVSPIHSFWSL
jgi:hypothetical protein